MATELAIRTPLPPDAAEQVLLAHLRDHETYIRTTCPRLVARRPGVVVARGGGGGGPPDADAGPGPGPGRPCAYEMTDKRAVGTVAYTLTLTTVEAGMDAVVEGRAPTGPMKICSRWRARGGHLEETVVIESNRLARSLIRRNVEREHAEFHRVFLAAAATKVDR
ncbi:hypothetical protein F4802DRAFT_614899 [Xylaria palmicola]|nr:hypothetical protein F4802DRAFT_614899 [Xylaria palmicola]